MLAEQLYCQWFGLMVITKEPLVAYEAICCWNTRMEAVAALCMAMMLNQPADLGKLGRKGCGGGQIWSRKWAVSAVTAAAEFWTCSHDWFP